MREICTSGSVGGRDLVTKASRTEAQPLKSDAVATESLP